MRVKDESTICKRAFLIYNDDQFLKRFYLICIQSKERIETGGGRLIKGMF